MKCIILLSLVALCYSYPYGTGYGSGYGHGYTFGAGKNFNVNSDGSITMTTADGKIITITKGFGQENVVVHVNDPIVSANQYFYHKYQPYQDDTLAQILAQYQGEVNQNAFQQLLGDVNTGVQNGQINHAIYQALQNLNQYQNQVGHIQDQVVFGGPVSQQLQQLQQVQQLQQAQQMQQLQQAQQIQQLLQQQGQNQWDQPGVYVTGNQQQYPFGQITGTMQEVIVPVGVNQQGQIIEKVLFPNTVSTGKLAWNRLINNILNGNAQQVGPFGQTTTGQLYQLVQKERQILNQQDQIKQEQWHQQHQQKQLLEQQFEQQQQQQQQQNKQQYVQELQQQVQNEQEQVLEQQKQQQQQQKFNTLRNLLQAGKQFDQTGNQQTIFWQHQPYAFNQEVYGQGFQHQNIPLVY